MSMQLMWQWNGQEYQVTAAGLQGIGQLKCAPNPSLYAPAETVLSAG